jgi:ribosomal protein S7
MSRRSQAPRRHSLPDPKFGNAMLAKFINMVMKREIVEEDRLQRDQGVWAWERQSRAIELWPALDNIKSFW